MRLSTRRAIPHLHLARRPPSPLAVARAAAPDAADECYLCRRPIEPGDSVVFTDRGVAHMTCYLERRRRGDAEGDQAAG
jgi:hypothetical protein